MTASRPDQSSEDSPQPEQSLGSPSTGEPLFLAVGKLRRPHGIEGELVMDILTDFPERLRRGVTLYVGEQHVPLRLLGRRVHGSGLLVKLAGYSSREAAGELTNSLVYVRAEDRPPLPEGEFYHHQLLGLRVVDEQDQVLGVLEQILETGANDVYVVRPERGPEILLPGIPSVILNINLERSEIRVHILPGLLPE